MRGHESGSRVWFYERGQWKGKRPRLSSDEYGRRTLVLPIPFGPTAIIALYTCRCADCDESREQTTYFDWLDRKEDDR